MKIKMWKAAPLAALAVLVLAGCATRIPIEAQRTPNLDTAGIQRIAVAPFASGIAGPEHQALANALTSEVTARLTATNAFTLVSYQTVAAARARGADISNYVDAILSGRVSSFSANVIGRSHAETVLRNEAEQRAATIANAMLRSIAQATAAATFPAYRLNVNVAFEYYIVRARDGQVIGPIGRGGSVTRANDNRNALPAPMPLATGIVQNQLRLFYRDVVPHTVVVRVALENEPDRDLRPQMNSARDNVRAGNYVAARQMYLAIWENHQSVAAAVNVAILYEATGDLDSAINFIYYVSAVTGAPRANDTLVRLNAEMEEFLGLAAFEDGRTQMERVAEHAVNEVKRFLPEGARVWIHSTATANQGMVNDVIDTMAYTLIGSDIPIIERQLIDLITAEQDLHLTGAVSDNDFISIGNMAGANTIVAVGITGAGAARRLQVRVLDIETSTVRMQSGTGALWSL